jgi:Tfp pilus assembly protein PilO
VSRIINPTPIFAATGLALLVGVGGNFWLYNGVSQSTDEYNSLKKQVKDEKKLKSELAGIQVQLAESQSKLDHLEQSVPATDYVPTLLTELERLGTANGLKITGVRPKIVEKKKEEKKPEEEAKDGKKKKPEKKETKGYDEFIIEVKGTGYYSAISNFVNALNTFPKIVGVYTLDIAPQSRVDDVAGPKVLELNMEIKAYVFAPEKEDKTARANTTNVLKDEHDG